MISCSRAMRQYAMCNVQCAMCNVKYACAGKISLILSRLKLLPDIRRLHFFLSHGDDLGSSQISVIINYHVDIFSIISKIMIDYQESESNLTRLLWRRLPQARVAEEEWKN